MKKVLLGTAVLGLALAATPASAEIKLGLGGFFRGYAVNSDNNDTAGTQRAFSFARDSELHFTGETALDNGLTVGFHHEQALGLNTAANTSDETYAYFSGGWGRVNFGNEDGAAYLLQVAAPSADSNVDGLRSYINSVTTLAGAQLTLDYDHADFKNAQRITYLTPKFNGFQAGISYAPQNEAGANAGIFVPAANNNVGQFEDLYELAARWDGEFQGLGLSVGGGYSSNSTEAVTNPQNGTVPAGVVNDDLTTWNLGANVAWNSFSVGAAYIKSTVAVGDGGLAATAIDVDNTTKTWVVGGAWDNGPYHVGVSYLDRAQDNVGGITTTAGELDDNRFTVGGGYSFGPGMTFRGAVATGSQETGANVETADYTQVTVGTDIQF